jgi:hypothetical protein
VAAAACKHAGYYSTAAALGRATAQPAVAERSWHEQMRAVLRAPSTPPRPNPFSHRSRAAPQSDVHTKQPEIEKKTWSKYNKRSLYGTSSENGVTKEMILKAKY